MNKRIILPTALFAAILVLSLAILIKDRNNEPTDQKQNGTDSLPQIIFYYGDTCPHCKIVEEYVDKNKIQDNIPFVSKEVYNNKENSNELVAKAKICGLATDSIGVPFLWDGKNCLIGDQPIIKFFNEKINGK